jgi:diguanylate cyclase (GGDEF)-like protein
MKNSELARSQWMHRYKRKVIIGILAVLSISIALTMILTAFTLRTRLLEDSKNKTWELSEVIGSSLRHLMLVRNTEKIQETLEGIGSSGSSIVKAFILDRGGKVIYSSRREEIGRVIDRFQDHSCSVCHTSPRAIPSQTTIVMQGDAGRVLRNVNVIHNDSQCHDCHDPSRRINGKLIIDRAVTPTTALISDIELILALSGGLCLIFLVPLLSKLLSRGVNTYIHEVDARSTELAMLYMIVERLSTTIEMEELKQIVIETMAEIFDPDEVHIVLPREGVDHTGVIWRKADRKIERRMGPGEDPHREVIIAWLTGNLPDIEISPDQKVVAIPVDKGNDRLALLIIGKADGKVNAFGVNLMKAMGSHIAVAFENAALYRIAITDELTGLYTKRHFRQTIEKKFELFEHYGEKLTLLMIDIDDFKKVNDTYGHPAGDGILKDVAQSILNSTREQDFDCRYGGEEFAVILPATDPEAGRVVAERIRQVIAGRAFAAGEQQLSITVSIGVASCPFNAGTIRDLVVASDKALYEAKRTGKNRVVMSREASS